MGSPLTIPNMNPTGVIGAGSGNVMPGQSSTPFSQFMPGGTGGPGTMNFGNSANPQVTPSSSNPYMAMPSTPVPSSPTPTPGAPVMSPGGPPAPSPVTGINNQILTSTNTFDITQRQQDRFLGELQHYYGEGVGAAIFQYLNSGAGYNSALTQQAIDAQTNAAQQQIQLGANDLVSMLGAQGVTGTGLTQSLTNYENQATQQLNAITAQEFYNMWNASQNRELAMLGDVANVNATGTANQSNWMDYLNEVLGIAGSFIGSAGF